MPASEETPVLIVGAGPVGLTAATLLSRFKVPFVLVEKHPSTSHHPKARSINSRTMEIFRQCGVEEEIRAQGLSSEKYRFTIWAHSLAGKELERRLPFRASAEVLQLSPVRNVLCPQHLVEPILRRRVESQGVGQLRFSTELESFEQRADGVTATLRRDGSRTQLRARYMLAADGVKGRVREALGVRMIGEEGIYRSVNVHLRADLTRYVAERPSSIYMIEQPDLKGVFLTVNGTDEWGFLIFLPADGSPQDYTAERCDALARQAVGDPDLDLKVVGVVPWVASAQVAERFRQGRVFLAGDAAHEMPPSGGFGMNTGVQDAHNLAWKLAAVIKGWAGEALLDTYDAERRPVDRAIVDQVFANSKSRGLGGGGSAPSSAIGRHEFLNETGMIYGMTYDSAALVPDGSAPPKVDNPVANYAPVGRPGHRAPHAWLERQGRRLSTLDLFGGGFVLLAGARGAAWRDAARACSAAPIDAFTVGAGGDLADPEGRWSALYGVGEEGAVLVRPDGYVAWRSAAPAVDAPSVLRQALSRVLARSQDAAC